MPLKPAAIPTKRLLLQSVTEDSREAMFRIFADESVSRTYMMPVFDGPAAMEKLFRRFMTLSDDRERFVYGIYLGGQLIGFLNEVQKDEDAIELGYVIHPDWQNRGCMTEALAAAVEALFRMGYHTVRAGFFEGNDASRRVMEKCGMARTGQTEEIEYRGIKHKCICYEIKAG